MSDKERFDAVNGISRRKALQRTVGLTGTVVGLSGVAAADEDPYGQSPRDRSRMDSEYILDEDYWHNENGRVEFDHADFDEWNVSVSGRQSGRNRSRSQTADDRSRSVGRTPPEVTDEVDIFIGENSNTSVRTAQVVNNAGPRAFHAETGPDTAVTPVSTHFHDLYKEVELATTSIPDWVPGIGGTKFGFWGKVWVYTDWQWCYVALTFDVGVTSVILLGEWFYYDIDFKDDRICATVIPADLPIKAEGCLTVVRDGDNLAIEGDYDICAPPSDPCWLIDCQYCYSDDLHADIGAFCKSGSSSSKICE